MPSSRQIRAAVFGPTPGSRRKSTTPAGTRRGASSSAVISPVSAISTTFFSIVFADPGELLRLPVERELGDRARRLADPRRRPAVRDDLERLLVEDLREVREQVELVGELGVPGQRRHPAMIGARRRERAVLRDASRRPLPPDLQRAREPRADDPRARRRARHRRATACSSSTTARPTAPARSPTGSRPSSRGSPSCTASARRESARAYIAGFRAALAEGAELVLEMDCDFSHDPADVPRLIAAARTTPTSCSARATRRAAEPRTGGSSAGSSRAAAASTRSSSSASRVRDLTGGFKCFRRAGARGDRPRRALRARLRVPDRDDVPRAACRAPRREVPITFVERARGASKMTGAIVPRRCGRCRAPAASALPGRL